MNLARIREEIIRVAGLEEKIPRDQVEIICCNIETAVRNNREKINITPRAIDKKEIGEITRPDRLRNQFSISVKDMPVGESVFISSSQMGSGNTAYSYFHNITKSFAKISVKADSKKKGWIITKLSDSYYGKAKKNALRVK